MPMIYDVEDGFDRPLLGINDGGAVHVIPHRVYEHVSECEGRVSASADCLVIAITVMCCEVEASNGRGWVQFPTCLARP